MYSTPHGCNYVTLHHATHFTRVHFTWCAVNRSVPRPEARKNRYLDEVSIENRYCSRTNQIAVFGVAVL